MLTIDLVLGTLGRTVELKRFLESLQAQTCRSFRLLLVDQNPDQRVPDLLATMQFDFSVLYLWSEPGLSRARNFALQHVEADLVAFPDDDCWYPAHLLEQVVGIFDEHAEWDGITGTANSGDQAAGSQWKWEASAGKITPLNVWRRGISFSLFLRRKVVLKTGMFDERLGVGADTPWGSGEETDYLIRAGEAGFWLQYLPDLTVHHPDRIPEYSRADAEKAYRYGAGMGFVLRKHRYPAWFVAKELLRPALNVPRSLLLGSAPRAYYFSHVFQGRLSGWLSDTSVLY